MRKTICLLLCLLAPALAAAQEGLPQGAIDALAAAHPGYEISAYDGWGDEARGQYAAVISKDGDNILCIAEKGEGDEGYILTIDNTNAVYDHEAPPSLMIDSGGDCLYYIYGGDQSSTHFHAVKENGVWGGVDVISYYAAEGGFRTVWGGIDRGMLLYEHMLEDENGNLLSRWYDVPVLISDAAEEQMLLARFDIELYDPDPSDGLDGYVETPGFTRGLIDEGDTLEQLAVSRVHLAALVSRPCVGQFVTISEWDVDRYVPVNILGVDDQAKLSTYYAREGVVRVDNGGMSYTITRTGDGRWYLTGVDPDTQRKVGPDWAYQNDIANIGRNDGYVYGDTWWDDFAPGHIDLPVSYEEALERMDTGAYALVHNPNPEDRLHLREKADKGAKSLGKFYNRTPVRVLERGDTWTKVRVGIGDHSLTGYMMTQYLAFAEKEKAELACAFPQLHLQEAYWDTGIILRAQPDPESESRGRYFHQSEDMIIGVYGDEWFIVRCADGSVGYVLQSAFWAGNG